MSQEKKLLGLNKNVFILGLVSMFNDMASEMIFPLIPFFLTSVLGAGVGFVGLMEGIAESVASFLKVFSGWLSDKTGQRKIFAFFGYSISTVVKPVLYLATAPWHVLAVRILDRVGKGTRDAPRDALISLSVEKKDLGKSFGYHRTMDTVGAIIGPLLAFFLLPILDNNYRFLFLLSFFAGVAAVFLIIFVKEIHDGIDRGSKIKLSFKSFNTDFKIFIIGVTIFSLGEVSIALPILRAQELGLVIVLLPIIYAVSNITYAIFSTPFGIISDRIGHRKILIFGYFVFALTFLGFAFTKSLFWIWILFGFYGLFRALTEGIQRAIVADLVEERLRGTAYGIHNTLTGIALFPASAIAGYLWQIFNVTIAFSYCAILALAAVLVLVFVRVK